jgi:DNA-binding beta-propeller fold protein YncE
MSCPGPVSLITRLLLPALLLVALPAHAAAATGALTQLPGAGGCITNSGKQGCAKGRAVPQGALAISRDGRSVYASGSSLAAFARNAATGALSQLAGTAGCLSKSGANGCTKVPELADAADVAVSDDGRNVYAAGVNGVVVFARNTATGALNRLAGSAGCVRNAGSSGPAGCPTARGLGNPAAVAVSRDGRNVYVAANGSGAIAVFTRDASTGALAQPAGDAGCVADTDSGEPCAKARGLFDANAVAVSPDSTTVYAGSRRNPDDESGELAIFTRDPATGALTQPAGAAGCVVDSQISRDGCAKARSLTGPSVFAFGPGGRTLYVGSTALVGSEEDLGGDIAVFKRTPAGALTQPTGGGGCVDLQSGTSCPNKASVSDVSGLAISADGKSAYVADAVFGGAVGVFARNPSTGALTQLRGKAGCLNKRGSKGCSQARWLQNPEDVVVSPDSRNVYATSQAGGGVLVFKRQRAASTSATAAKKKKPAAAVKFKVTSVSGFLYGVGSAFNGENPGGPCGGGSWSGYIGGTNPRQAGFQTGGFYKGRVLASSGTFDPKTGKGLISARVVVPYEQSGFRSCDVQPTDDPAKDQYRYRPECNIPSATETLNMKISVAGRRIAWDPGAEVHTPGPDQPAPLLPRVGIVPSFVCPLATRAYVARIEWLSEARTTCANPAPAASTFSRKGPVTLVLDCKRAADATQYGFSGFDYVDVLGATYFFSTVNGMPAAEHKASITFKRQ